MSYLDKLFDLTGKVSVVTGGLGLLGSEYALALANCGSKVCIIDKNDKIPDVLVDYISAGKIEVRSVDITDREKVCEVYDWIHHEFTVPSVLINNAAIDFPPVLGAANEFETYPIDKWRQVLDVNLTGTLVCCQVFGGAMAKAGRGSVINISSTYGLVSPDQRIYEGFTKPVSYSASKSGIINFTKYLATYWAKNNVRVNTLVPGGVYNDQNEGFVAKYSERVPMGRMANKNEYNGAVVFLASDASSYMTGSTLVVDGGWTAW